MDSLVKTHKIPFVTTFIEAKARNTVRKEATEYLDHLKKIATRKDLGIQRHTFQNYIGGPTKINTMFSLLKKETQTHLKIAYLDAMEARVHF